MQIASLFLPYDSVIYTLIFRTLNIYEHDTLFDKDIILLRKASFGVYASFIPALVWEEYEFVVFIDMAYIEFQKKSYSCKK